jgi:hypothetical protein
MDARKQDAPSLTDLQSLLATARAVVDAMADDPFADRLKRAFAQLPESDRETILGVLERDATWCRIVAATAGTTGITVRANPHASLYLHVFNEVGTSQRDLDVIGAGIERFVDLMPLFFQEGVHAQWTAAARELIRVGDPAFRDLALRLAREVIALIEEEAPAATG